MAKVTEQKKKSYQTWGGASVSRYDQAWQQFYDACSKVSKKWKTKKSSAQLLRDERNR